MQQNPQNFKPAWGNKFRAWDKARNEMYEPHTLHINPVTRCFMSIRYNGDFGEDSILMRFTGLIDKTGKEIYDGDILKGTKAGIGYIKWTNACFHIFREHQGVRHAALSLKVAKSLTVIGNIYANPERVTGAVAV